MKGGKIKASNAEPMRLLQLEFSYLFHSPKLCTLSVLRKIILCETLLIKKKTVVKCYCYEMFPEMSIERVLQFANERIPEFHHYMLDPPLTSAMIKLRYLLDLVNSLIPGSMQQIRREAIRGLKMSINSNGQEPA